MRLYQRTLGSFIAVILMEGILSGVFIAATLGGMQSEDASRELRAEAASVYKSFNAWKLSLWKIANELPTDPGLLGALASRSDTASRIALLGASLKRTLAGSGAELCLVRDIGSGKTFTLPLSAKGQGSKAPDPSMLSYPVGHPFIDMVEDATGLWFSGATSVEGLSGRAEIYVLKAIDPELVSQLGSNERARSLIRAGGRSVSSWAENPAWIPAFLAFMDKKSLANAYSIFARSPGFDGASSSAVMSSGTYLSGSGRGTLYVSVVLSLSSYRSRLARIDWTVALVCLLAALLTMVSSSALARSVANPVRDLLSAMMRLRAGETGVAVSRSKVAELEGLLAGFNDMARNLDSDKADIGAYIAQIVKLKEYNEEVIDSIREGLAVVDPEGRVEKANAAFERLFGPGDGTGSAGRALADLRPELFGGDGARGADARAASVVQRRWGARTFEIKRSGLGDAEGRPRLIYIVEDVSERVGYEERMMQAEKLSSIGLLSAGIAHEVNNPLGSILSNVQNLIAEEADPGKSRILGIIEGETKRIARIVRELMAFSAPETREADGLAPDSCDPSAVAAEIATLVGYSFRAKTGLALVTDLRPCPPAAMGPDELKQILLNLLGNAIQAVGASGEIRLSVLREGDRVVVRVEDSGPGFSPEVLPRICDPFFTTRAREGGMGLGLSVVYGIVTRRGGSLKAENRESGGARIGVLVPIADGKGNS